MHKGTYILIGTAVVLVAVFIVTALLQTTDDNSYNGFTFQQRQEGSLSVWDTVVDSKGNLYQVTFYHHPSTLEDVIFEPGIADLLRNPETRPSRLYLTLPADAGSRPVVAGVEISKLTGYGIDFLNIETRSALQESTNSSDIAVITCEDATPDTVVISFSMGDYNMVHLDENNPRCIHLMYETANDSIRVADRFGYGLLGIMQG